MYNQSKNVNNIKKVCRPTRTTEKLVFNIPAKCSTGFLKSPYYIGTQLWNGLNNDVQRVETTWQFDKKIRPL